jgi:hypothetical protein
MMKAKQMKRGGGKSINQTVAKSGGRLHVLAEKIVLQWTHARRNMIGNTVILEFLFVHSQESNLLLIVDSISVLLSR